METSPISELRSRRRRKRLNRITALLGGQDAPIRKIGPLYLSRRNFSWWIGTLFMIGAFCFAAGTVIAVSDNPEASGIVYFVGSIFFTTAAYFQFLEAVNTDGPGEHRTGVRAFAWLPERIEWRATFIQLIGTLFFNVSTFAAMRDFAPGLVERRVWAPDVLGSICFLVASWLAYWEVRSNWRGHPERGSEWWVTVLNLVGSIAFGISAIGAYVIKDTGDVLNAVAANSGTFIGAVCFFAGAYLLWPEAADAAAAG